MASRSQTPAEKWVHANCTIEKMRQHLLNYLGKAHAQGVDCYVLLGSGFTPFGYAHWLAWVAGELFVFPLTDAQAAQIGLGEWESKQTMGDLKPYIRPSVDHVATIHDIEMPSVILATDPFVVEMAYEPLVDECPELWCLQIDFAFPDGWHTVCPFCPKQAMENHALVKMTFP